MTCIETNLHAAFLDAIRAEPEADGPRLTYADWLREQGDEERYQFIYAQCELARLGECHHAMDAPELLTCPKCPLRRLEAELLSTVHPEKCECAAKNGWAEPGITICMKCDRKRTVTRSNAVRWAGNLAGRTTNKCIEGVDQHIVWSTSNHTDAIHARFRRGLLDCVSLSCAALVGEVCAIAQGDEPWGHQRCTFCHGSGRVGGLLRELATGEQFAGLMQVVLSDKRPYEMTQFSPSLWVIGNSDSAPERQSTYGLEHYVPDEIWTRLEGFILARPNSHATWKWFDSAFLAASALSSAAFALVRSVRTTKGMLVHDPIH